MQKQPILEHYACCFAEALDLSDDIDAMDTCIDLYEYLASKFPEAENEELFEAMVYLWNIHL